MKFEQAFEEFMHIQIADETNGRRQERLEKGLGHAETEFLRAVWYPAVGHFEHLYPEWEVRCNLALDGWIVLPIAYSSIIETPKPFQQLVLSLIGKFLSTSVPVELTWLESETVRFARRLLRPFTPTELADHLKVSKRYVRTLLHPLVEMKLLSVMSGQERVRTYRLHI